MLVKGFYKVYNIPVGGLCKPYKGNWMFYQFGRKWIKSMVKN